MARLGRNRDDGESKDIDISPLIDMVFILLIFFMVSTTFVKDAKVDLDRPSASSAERASSKAIRIYIDKSQNVFLDDVPVRPWMVQSRIKERLAGGADQSILVITDRNTPAQKLIDVVDACRLAGAADIGVVTDLEQG